ncbi:MAG: diphthine synthase [Candidatus Diapherotrites archaeon]|nr:diphthine synthase [Candidatus Diapherotrites archaeon]
MFYLIGLGLKPEQITLEALNAMKACSELYFDSYTSCFSEGGLAELEKLVGRKIVSLQRAEIEEHFIEKLKEAREKSIALLVVGNALFATTHLQLLIDCANLQVPYKFIPGISLTNYLGLTGLSNYRFGETVSIVMPEPNYAPESFYDKIARNYKNNLHTLCLIDIKNGKPASVKDALQRLLEIEETRNEKIIKDALIIIISSLGSKKQSIVAGKASEIMHKEFARPASLIICSKLSEKEREALHALHRVKL